MSKCILNQQLVGSELIVTFKDIITGERITEKYDAVTLGCQWFSLTNDQFHAKYGFNLNPHDWFIKHNGRKVSLYKRCRDILYGA